MNLRCSSRMPSTASALRRHRNPDANTIALNERTIAQLKDKIARLGYAQPQLLRDPMRFAP
jgi:hypothetical protein